MIIPKYVAVQANLESAKTAFADLKYVEPILNLILERKDLSINAGVDVLGYKPDVAQTIFNLLNHIGILNSRIDTGMDMEFYSLTSFGRYMLETKKESQTLVQPLIPFFLTWLPLKLFLKFLLENPGADLDKIRDTLGDQTMFHTKEAATLLNAKTFRGGRRPFNEMAVENVLSKIGEYLGLTYTEKRFGPYFLTPLGKYVTDSIDLLNFQFKNLDTSYAAEKLAILDFAGRGAKNLIVFCNQQQKESIKKFVFEVEENTAYRMRINYNISHFTAVLSTDSAFWAFADVFSNVTYDPIKVLEFNTKVLDYIK